LTMRVHGPKGRIRQRRMRASPPLLRAPCRSHHEEDERTDQDHGEDPDEQSRDDAAFGARLDRGIRDGASRKRCRPGSVTHFLIDVDGRGRHDDGRGVLSVAGRIGWGGSTASSPSQCEIGRAPDVDRSHPAHAASPGSSQVAPRHPRTVAYRCFLPDLTGFTGLRCVGPDFRRRAMKWEAEVIDLGREFSPAVADCGCRAPLVPRLARPVADGRPGWRGGQRRRRVGGGEGGIRTPDGFPRTAFPVRRHRPLGDLSGTMFGARTDRGMAERVGFEPTVLIAHRFSRAAP
jgi:hypothetical protein